MSIIVKAKPGDNSDKVVRAFQKRVAEEDVVKEYRERQFYKSNSEKRQERLAEKRRKINKARKYAN